MEDTEIHGTVDNCWVIPYGPALLNMLQCLLNDERCISRICGIEDLFKYNHKVSDSVTKRMVRVQRQYDEISRFEKARYVSASQALCFGLL